MLLNTVSVRTDCTVSSGLIAWTSADRWLKPSVFMLQVLAVLTSLVIRHPAYGARFPAAVIHLSQLCSVIAEACNSGVWNWIVSVIRAFDKTVADRSISNEGTCRPRHCWILQRCTSFVRGVGPVSKPQWVRIVSIPNLIQMVLVMNC